MKGLKTWKNKNNGFQCVQLHYSADPKKRTKEWKKAAQFGMDHKAWQTEMELSWEVYAGEPVYGKEFNREIHIPEERIEPNPDYPMLIRGWDFGGNHSCAIMQYIRGRMDVFDEYANVGYNTRRIAKEITEDCAIRYGREFHYIEAIDPSGMWEGKTSTGLACADIMREMGLRIAPGDQDPTRRVDSVMKFLVTLHEGRPAFRINKECPVAIEGFLGGYHYPEKVTKNQKHNRPEKNGFSHVHDAIQYGCTIVDSMGDPYYGEIDLENLEGYIFDF